jgi:hypothetical protein
MTTQMEITQKNHRRAVRFFWGLLVGATTASLIGNIAHAVLPYLSRIVIQIGAAAVPPIALLAAKHGIALAVRAGASGRFYRWAVTAVAAIGVGAFSVSFLALRDLMRAIGYSSGTAWIFPAIIDTTIGVSTMMLVALGDKPARRAPRVSTQTPPVRRAPQNPVQSAKTEVTPFAPTKARAQTVQAERVQSPASLQREPTQTVHDSAHTQATQVDAGAALELIACGVTTQALETVIAVLAATRDGASINAAAKASGINYRTAQRIVEAAAEHRQRQLVAVG